MDYILKTYSPNSRGTLVLGQQYDHNETKIRFVDWRHREGLPLFFKIGSPVNKLIPLNSACEFMVQQPYTIQAYITKGQLMSQLSDGTYVAEGRVFNVRVLDSLHEELEEVADARLDTIYAEMYEGYVNMQALYDILAEAYENEQFIPKRGVDYWTEADIQAVKAEYKSLLDTDISRYNENVADKKQELENLMTTWYDKIDNLVRKAKEISIVISQDVDKFDRLNDAAAETLSEIRTISESAKKTINSLASEKVEAIKSAGDGYLSSLNDLNTQMTNKANEFLNNVGTITEFEGYLND